jgi:hypothetical protein
MCEKSVAKINIISSKNKGIGFGSKFNKTIKRRPERS